MVDVQDQEHRVSTCCMFAVHQVAGVRRCRAWSPRRALEIAVMRATSLRERAFSGRLHGGLGTEIAAASEAGEVASAPTTTRHRSQPALGSTRSSAVIVLTASIDPLTNY